MMNKLYFQSSVDDSFKILINNYVKKNLNYIKDPSYIYKFSFNELEEDETFLDKISKKAIMGIFDDKGMKPQTITYENPNIDYEKLKTEAKQTSSSTSTNNSYGISDNYFTKYVEPSIKNGDFPYTIIVPQELDKNQEYQDFLSLLELLKDYKIKPLFIAQDLNPYVFVKNRETMNSIMSTIKSKVEENNLKKYLNQNVGDEVKDYTLEKRDGYYSVTFTATGNEYAVWENGTVQDMDEYQKTPYLKLDPSELNALETESSQVIKAITNVDNPNISWETNNSNIVTINTSQDGETTIPIILKDEGFYDFVTEIIE
jgi:hypothetical protein